MIDLKALKEFLPKYVSAIPSKKYGLIAFIVCMAVGVAIDYFFIKKDDDVIDDENNFYRFCFYIFYAMGAVSFAREVKDYKFMIDSLNLNSDWEGYINYNIFPWVQKK